MKRGGLVGTCVLLHWGSNPTLELGGTRRGGGLVMGRRDDYGRAANHESLKPGKYALVWYVKRRTARRIIEIVISGRGSTRGGGPRVGRVCLG